MGVIERLVILVLVVYGVMQFGRRLAGGVAQPSPEPGPQPKARRPVIEDMTQCSRCGTYVAAGAAACARGDCPRRG